MSDNIDLNQNDNKDSDKKNKYEKICFVCRRPESKTGAMVSMSGNMDVCPDCMQRAFDAMNNSNIDFSKLSNMPFMNMNIDSLKGMNLSKNQQIKKEEDSKEPLFTMKDIPAPHIIKSMLDEYVIGQEKAKKAISVAVYNHYKRVFLDHKDKELKDITKVEKSNILMIGPTGSGKTYLVKTLARLLKVPLAIADATSLTEAGYIGDDIESVISKLLSEADNEVKRAECGIVFIDEIDKIAKKKNVNTRDVSGESVQQELLKLLEGSKVEVPVGSNQKNALSPMVTVNTDNILFICGGAFPDLENIIKDRLKGKASLGFNSVLKDEIDKNNDVLKEVSTEDIRKFGMIPEFLGRLPITVTLSKLSKENMIKVLKEPKNAILKQYIRLLELDEVKLEFEDEALEWVALKALEKDTGARALRSIIEDFMLDIMYEIPKDKGIGKVIITRQYLENNMSPTIEMRGQ